jgi:hypothetical protein
MVKSLEEINLINDIAQARVVYKKSIDNMILLTKEEFNKLPAAIIAMYKDYDEYTKKQTDDFKTQKDAIGKKLDEKSTLIDTLTISTVEEKMQWKAELNSVKSLVTKHVKA